MLKQLLEKSDCCGCSACYSICPTDAITMIGDEEGFKYPNIDLEKCIKCRLCEKVCPSLNDKEISNPRNIYAAKNKNENIRLQSSSGGVFSLLAEYIVDNNGVIYGAAYDSKFNVKHMRAVCASEWKKFCVSKYVASDIVGIYNQVKNDLKNEKLVLFSGTPCQVMGLKRFLAVVGVSCTNLITCDIVCHGTPSPKIWNDYLTLISKEKKKEISNISFRNKDKVGWHNSELTLWDNDKKVLLSEGQKDNFYFQLFFCHEILRPHCHNCKFSNFSRCGDVTLGDYWGVEKYYSEFDDDKGISLVMINTQAGVDVWNKINLCLDYFEIVKEQCKQPNLEKPSEVCVGRDDFWKRYKRFGLKSVGQQRGYFSLNAIDKIKNRIYKCQEKILRLLGKW